jgi:ribosomal protein L1
MRGFDDVLDVVAARRKVNQRSYAMFCKTVEIVVALSLRSKSGDIHARDEGSLPCRRQSISINTTVTIVTTQAVLF